MFRYGWNHELRDDNDPGGPGADPPKGNDPPGDPPESKTASIPLTALPEELRDKSEAEIQFTLGRLISGVTAANERNRELSAQLDDARKVPEPDPEPSPHDGKSVAELFEEGEHEAAFDRYLEKKGYVGAVEGTLSKVSSMEYENVRRETADFDEYRPDIDEILAGRPNVDSRTVRAAYTMARGARVIADEEKAKRALHSPEPVGDDPPKGIEVVEMDSFEKEVFEASGLSAERWQEMKSDDIEIKVPLSAGSK